jgi:purine-binding chemotaxis protein CheW
MTDTVTKNAVGGQYLTFVLNKERYAVDVAHTQTVLESTDITKIPRMPPFMLGVINFRGSVLPVVDLKKKLGIERSEETATARPMIIVLEIPFENDVLPVGATADAVQEVVDIDGTEIEDTPSIGTKTDTTHIQGIGKKDDSFVIILESQTLFAGAELHEVAAAGTQPS